MPPDAPPPTRLPPGTLVGPWRVLERLGVGAHGAVYRALPAHSPSSPVALKLARSPQDARFARERELRSRVHHPHVPCLLDPGEWLLAGFFFPYLVMEWVDGVSLYDWARLYRPSSRQVPAVPYSPTASDEVFALGVTAWRLLTGEYPSPPDLAFRDSPRDEASPPSPRALNPRCVAELGDLTARMRSPTPEARSHRPRAGRGHGAGRA